MLKRIIAALVVTSAVAFAPAAMAWSDHHHRHHHEYHHHYHHHHR